MSLEMFSLQGRTALITGSSQGIGFALARGLASAGATVIVPGPKDTKIGCVETLEEAVTVGKMFRESQVQGIVVSAVNFGDEQGVALAIKESGLKVPILIVGCQEEEAA